MKYIRTVFILLIATIPALQAQQLYTLDDCRSLAIQNNLAMKKARLNRESAQQLSKEAFTTYFPVISAAGGAFNANKSMAAISLDPLISGMDLLMLKDGMVGGVTAALPLFAGGQILNSNKLAKLGEEVSEYQLTQSEDEVELTVEQYYWQLVSLREKRKTVQSMEQLVDSILKDVTLAVDAGITNRNDLLQVQLKKNNLASNRLKVENGIEISRLVLAQYIGVPKDSFEVKAVDFSTLLPPDSYYVDPLEALPATTAYKLLEKNVEASKLQHRLTLGKYLPTASIGAGYMYHNLLEKDRAFGLAFVSVSVPISGWWGGSHALKRQKTQVKIAEYQQQNNRELLLIGMQKEYNDLVEYYKQVAIAEESIAKAEENLRLNRNYYQAGTVTMSDLLEAQSLLQQSRDQYTTDYTNYLIKRTQYLQATGR